MGDDESRREDARIEVAIDRALKQGTMGYCDICRDITPLREDVDETEEYLERWLCRRCQKAMEK